MSSALLLTSASTLVTTKTGDDCVLIMSDNSVNNCGRFRMKVLITKFRTVFYM
jgi:hypothetical protein